MWNSEAVLADVHFIITAVCYDYKEEIINNKFFWIQMEVDEKLMPTLTGINQRGSLKLGASSFNLIGGGIVQRLKSKLRRILQQIQLIQYQKISEPDSKNPLTSRSGGSKVTRCSQINLHQSLVCNIAAGERLNSDIMTTISIREQ